jgi:Carboxypeptidase regulatory-like domain
MNTKAFLFAVALLSGLLAPLASLTAQKESRATISGKVIDRMTSAPLAAELGLAIRTAKGFVMKHTRANEQGEFAFADLPAGEFHLSTKHDDYAVEHEGFALSSDETRSLDFRLVKARRVNGAVTDASRNPLAEARVQVFYEQETGFANRYQWEEGDVRTDAYGRFTTEVHPERVFVIQASSKGFLSEAVHSIGNEEVALRLTRGVAVTGTVSDEWGNPLGNAEVQLVAERDTALWSSFMPFDVLQQAHQTTVTQADGTFRFEQVRATEYALTARHPQAEPRRLMVNVTRKNEFAVTLARAASATRKDRYQR